ncbi:MAG: hypothetical protein V2I48_10150 [Xanthomonadales bacterium]|jgi:hypothetical protein|nr:hypothetical protein [Xanthomonadales bacterium]
MIHHLMTLFAPDGGAPQATLTSPPAKDQPACHPLRARVSIRFMAGVAANAAGFGMLLAGCWFSLQLMQVFLV